MNLLSKFKFLRKKQAVIVVTGKERKIAARAISDVLEKYFQVDKVLIFESADKEIKNLRFFLKKSQKAMLVITKIDNTSWDRSIFGREKEEIKNTLKLIQVLPAQVNLILNFDNETVREIKGSTNLKTLTFGFQEGANFKASDIKLNGGTNFKINYKGNVVPVWLDKIFGKEQIYAALCATAVGTVLGLNLIEISQAIKNYHSLPGRMRLIKGIKNSRILDNSESATLFSMIEALEILGKLENPEHGRRIAVLGDIIGIGKYTIEAHELIGEKIVKNCDLLFTFGIRAKFISKGALRKGMSIERIFQFNTIREGVSELQNKIKEEDIVLVDGSKEIEMNKIVEEIREI